MALVLISLMMIPIFIGYFFASLFAPLMFLFAIAVGFAFIPIYLVFVIVKMLSKSVEILIQDDGSPLIDLSITNPEFVSHIVGSSHIFVRGEIAKRLIEAQKIIPQGMHLRLDCGHSECVNMTGGAGPTEYTDHETGGAFDVKMVYASDNSDVDLGPMYRSPISSDAVFHTDSDEITMTQQRGRNSMSEALRASGFVNNPLQWWHWSYGDVSWARGSKLSAFAIFGPIHV